MASSGQEAVLKLLGYLSDLTQRLGTAAVHDVQQYHGLVWFDRVPTEAGCFTRAWGYEGDADPDEWLSVRRPDAPPRPEVPTICAPYVVGELDNPTEEPTLSSPDGDTADTAESADPPTDPQQAETPPEPPENTPDDEASSAEEPPPGDAVDPEAPADDVANLPLAETPPDDLPPQHAVESGHAYEVRMAWQAYLEELWRPWALAKRKWLKVQAFYSELFRIHQEQSRLGEQYELAVGFGLLSWQSPSGQRVRRHLVTVRAALEFDAERASFVLEPSSEGLRVSLEDDLLEPDERPSGSDRNDLLAKLRELSDPFDREQMEPLLRGWVRSLRSDAEYESELAPPDQAADETPRMRLAPAILLRRRSAEQTLSVIATIREQMLAGQEPPAELVRWLAAEGPEDVAKPQTQPAPPAAESAAESANAAQATDQAAEQPGDQALPDADGRVYFPLPSNDAQAAIVDRMRRSPAVLVQGPPGTGKSHTIANLICHLLAEGQRILITAHTPRALRVLQDKLPTSVQSLCVSLLGDDRAALDQLESSVLQITQQYGSWDRDAAQRRIDERRQRLRDLEAEQTGLESQLEAMDHADRETHEIADGAYRGSKQQIARRLAQQQGEFAWFRDRVDHATPPPFGPDTLREIVAGHRQVSPARLAELQRPRPALADVPEPDTVQRLVEAERQAKEAFDAFADVTSSPDYAALADGGPRRVERLIKSLTELKQTARSLARRKASWAEQAIHDVLTDHARPWERLHETTAERLQNGGLAERATQAEQRRVSIPDGVSHDTLKADAEDLKAHLEAGGGTGFWLFKPKVIQRAGYVMQSVTVEGRSCDTPETLDKLLDYLDVEQRVNQLWGIWQGKAEPVAGPLSLQVSELEEQQDMLKQVLDLHDAREQARAAWTNMPGTQPTGPEPAWHEPEAVDRLVRMCQAAQAQRSWEAAIETRKAPAKPLTEPPPPEDAHRLHRDLPEAILAGDADRYRELWHQLSELDADQKRVDEVQRQTERLAKHAPRLAHDLAAEPEDPAWDAAADRFVDAWNWARADDWLRQHDDEAERQQIHERLNQILTRRGEAVASLASELAWQHFFDRLGDEELYHLNGWMEQIRRIGRGTGRFAAYHRQVAQKYLERCRQAIPAWVMPLFRVIESVTPQPGMFDVVIVDEASQCGLDGLLLLYLAKKIIIVGDAEQISPEAVGIDRELVHTLIRDHLAGLPLAENFDPETSLFAHASMRLKDRVVLREHFRCMPEIIAFSNELSYRDQPLIPLRQYPLDRLKPTVRVHVAEGQAEEAKGGVINRQEADRLAHVVAACCADPRYEGKTLGVISLLGEAQAELIYETLLEQLGAEQMSARRLVCGDAYSFQGDERDVMLLSMVAAENRRIGALVRSADKRRFNVAASRARDQMWLVHSVGLNPLNPEGMRAKLLQHFMEPPTISPPLPELDRESLAREAARSGRQRLEPPRPFANWLEVDAYLTLSERGYRVFPGFPVAHYRLDLMIEGGGQRLAVLCDGDEAAGAAVEPFPARLAKRRTLERCGWRFARLPGAKFYRDHEAALAPLQEQLTRLNIQPTTGEREPATITEGYVPSWEPADAGQTQSEPSPAERL